MIRTACELELESFGDRAFDTFSREVITSENAICLDLPPPSLDIGSHILVVVRGVDKNEIQTLVCIQFRSLARRQPYWIYELGDSRNIAQEFSVRSKLVWYTVIEIAGALAKPQVHAIERRLSGIGDFHCHEYSGLAFPGTDFNEVSAGFRLTDHISVEVAKCEKSRNCSPEMNSSWPFDPAQMRGNFPQEHVL